MATKPVIFAYVPIHRIIKWWPTDDPISYLIKLFDYYIKDLLKIAIFTCSDAFLYHSGTTAEVSLDRSL